jgi:uncharacterized membrane protein YccC
MCSSECGVNYSNSSRVATLVLLFFFTMWAKYFIAQDELLTKRFAIGMAATILIPQVNYPQSLNYAWQMFATTSIGSAAAVIGSMFPFPNSARTEAEERWAHAVQQTQHLFKLLLEAFSCTSQGQLQARMLYTRIEESMARLLANMEALKVRSKLSQAQERGCDVDVF